MPVAGIGIQLNLSFGRPFMTYTKYTLLMLVAGICLSLPFLATSYPPATDLPQHLSQLHLFDQALNARPGAYEINWLAPGNLIYLLLFLIELVVPIEWAGRLLALFIVITWVGSIFWIARARNRPAESALLASLLVFNFCFYWGFLNFQLGAALFLLFFLQLLRPLSFSGWGANLGWLLLLYASHSFWFLAGATVLALSAFRDWPDFRQIALRLSVIILPGLLAVAWFVAIEQDRGATAVNASLQWLTTPGERLLPAYLVDAVFGGVQGALEPFVAACIFCWLLLALVTNRGNLRASVDQPLFLLACFFAAIVFLAPDRYLNSIFLARRFTPIAVVLLLLALPAPARVNAWLRGGYSVAVLLLFVTGTAFSWHKYERSELTGLEEALDAIPAGAGGLLGLEYIKDSTYIKGRPFLQLFSYGQAYRGAELNFSFAEHGSSLVSYAPDWHSSWTGGLEWYPERVTAGDLCQFDYVLINAESAAHDHYAGLPYLRALTPEGRWRLYAVQRNVSPQKSAEPVACGRRLTD
jgi:hypothetical protein